MILRRGVVDINSVGRCGHTPLICSMFYNYPAIAQALLSTPGVRPAITYGKTGLTALHFACWNNSLEAIPVFGEHATLAMLRIKDNRGDTPAMVAVRRGRLDCVKELDKLGGIPREDEKTLVELARRYEHPALLAYLQGRKRNVRTLAEISARTVARHCRYKSQVQTLEIPQTLVWFVSRFLDL